MKLDAKKIAGAIACLVVAWLCYWLVTSFERVPVNVEGGATPEARANHLLAAEHLLAELGLEAKSHRRLSELPPLDTVLFMPTSRRKLAAETVEGLIRWVRDGGHLIVVARVSERADRMLAPFGVSPAEPEVRDEPEEEGDPVTETADGHRVEFGAYVRLESQAEGFVALASDESGHLAATLRAGAGRLTVLADYRFAVNSKIGAHDHAAFLWRLVGLAPASGVWLVHGDEVPGLGERLAEQAWAVLVSLALLLLVWLWAASRRFGPLEPAPEPARRRLLEHVEASGRFLWRHGKSDELLATVRESLLRSVEFRHPGWIGADDLHVRLAHLSGFPPETVRVALEGSGPRDQNRFLQTIRTLETIRKKL